MCMHWQWETGAVNADFGLCPEASRLPTAAFTLKNLGDNLSQILIYFSLLQREERLTWVMVLSIFPQYCGGKKVVKSNFKEGFALAHRLRALSIMVGSHGCGSTRKLGTSTLQAGNNSRSTERGWGSAHFFLSASLGSQASG